MARRQLFLTVSFKLLRTKVKTFKFCGFFSSFKTGDRCGELTARMNVSDLQTVLGLSYSTNNPVLSENKEIDYNLHGKIYTP